MQSAFNSKRAVPVLTELTLPLVCVGVAQHLDLLHVHVKTSCLSSQYAGSCVYGEREWWASGGGSINWTWELISAAMQMGARHLPVNSQET